MRLRGYVDDVPKPMVKIGTRPILWHLMKYYAYFGHKDFILCLGYKGNVIKDYFLHYDESVSNDFVWSQGGKKIDFLNRDIDDWTITFVETGANATIGEDHTNNLEQVYHDTHLLAPGTWALLVIGHHIPEGPQKFSVAHTPERFVACLSVPVDSST